MKIFKKIIAFTLAALMCLVVLVGCKKDEAPQEETTASNYVSTTAPSDADLRAMEQDNLPEWVNTKYRGRTISTYSFRENYERDINGYGEITGDTFYDLIYKRNLAVEERLGIKLNNVISDTSSFADYGEELSIMANSNSNEYSIIYTMGNSAIRSGIEHIYFSDVTQFEHLSLDSPWWNKEAMIAQSFNGKKLNYLIGDITITTYTKAGAIFVNSTEYNNRYSEGINGLYDTVIDGKWTIELLAKKASENYTDVGKEGLELDSNDFIGFGIGNPVRVKALEYGFDVKRWTRDEEGFVKIDYDVERASLAVEKLIDLLFKNPGVYYESGTYIYSQSFAPGNMLFYENQLGTLMSYYLREMSEDFGVLPTPKLDENQSEYMTEIQESSTLVAIPVTCEDTEFTTVVIEALCAESYRKVIYPFIEECMKIQYVRDSRSGNVIDIILNSATKDYLGLYNPGKLGKLIATIATSETNVLASQVTQKIEAAEAELKNLKEKYYIEP